MIGLPMVGEPGYAELGWFKHVELEINTACDLACFGCDRFSDVASRGVPNMTVAQVARFVDESLALNWRWERIRLLGGEPTIHPQFLDCCAELLRYRASFPAVFLQVLTNGNGKADKHRPTLEKHGFSLHAERKQKGVQPSWFHNTRIVPVDRDPTVGELPPCGIYGERGCGVGLTRHGYFIDGAGASVARVAGHDVGVMRLSEVTHERMMEQAKVLCRLCGHWNPIDATWENGKAVTKKISETGLVTGPFWTKTLAAYHEKKPTLRVYGD